MTRLDDGGVERLRRAIDAPEPEGERYRVLEPLGRGGMGTVYLAEDRLLGRPVALKVLHVEDLSDEAAERMLREARTLARLEHPGIVPIHDLGRLPDGRVFYAMKQVRGERLDRRAGADTPLAERLRLFLKLCESMAFAHAAGVLHRDLKPENVMVGEFGEALILDWGIARWTGRAARAGNTGPPGGGAPAHDDPLAHAALTPAARPGEADVSHDGLSPRDTRPGTVMGTPAYMAPEQARGDVEHVDARTDVYGLGATLWFLITGHPPAHGGAAAAGARRTADGRPQGVAAPPGPLASICARAMAAEPERRYESVHALAEDVRRHLNGERPFAHREGPLARVTRVAGRHRVALGLVLAYLALRVALWAFSPR